MDTANEVTRVVSSGLLRKGRYAALSIRRPMATVIRIEMITAIGKGTSKFRKKAAAA
ncbi:hypothetical protein D3C78_1918560 [compost metagenome]